MWWPSPSKIPKAFSLFQSTSTLFSLPCSQRVKYLPLQVALSLLAPIAEDDEIKKKSLRVSTMQCLLGNVRSLILE